MRCCPHAHRETNMAKVKWWDRPQRFSVAWEEFIRVDKRLYYKGLGDVIWRELQLQKALFLPHTGGGGGMFHFTDIVTGRRGELQCSSTAATVRWLSPPGTTPT